MASLPQCGRTRSPYIEVLCIKLNALVGCDQDYDLNAEATNEKTREVLEFTRQLDCGMVWVNCWLLRDLRVPFGGSKASGVGREGADHR